MNLEQYVRVFLLLEMLIINLITTHYSMRKKNSLMKVITVLIGFTLFIFMLTYTIRTKFNLIQLSDSMIMVLGFAYFFPLKYLYDESSEITLAVMFFSWIHTISVLYISHQLTYLLKFSNYHSITFIIQTLICLISTPLIIRFINNKFLYILANISTKMTTYFISLTTVQFITLSIVHLFFAKNTYSYWKIATISLITLTTFVSYTLIYLVVKSSKNIHFLEHLAYTDNLTGTKNRLSLFIDCQDLITENKPFTIIYMDLDNFKQVNDTYGHSVGDDYLIHFTKATIGTINEKGRLYRMSGDEFICIYHSQEIDLFLSTFNDNIINSFDLNIPFLGVSIGYSKFPQDGHLLDVLIKKADSIMYRVKNTQ